MHSRRNSHRGNNGSTVHGAPGDHDGLSRFTPEVVGIIAAIVAMLPVLVPMSIGFRILLWVVCLLLVVYVVRAMYSRDRDTNKRWWISVGVLPFVLVIAVWNVASAWNEKPATVRPKFALTQVIDLSELDLAKRTLNIDNLAYYVALEPADADHLVLAKQAGPTRSDRTIPGLDPNVARNLRVVPRSGETITLDRSNAFHQVITLDDRKFDVEVRSSTTKEVEPEVVATKPVGTKKAYRVYTISVREQ
jgi:hypothetical protein